MPNRLLIIQAAGLSRNVLELSPTLRDALPGPALDLGAVFPALTCPAQASFRTATAPAVHGIVANGQFDRATRRTEFWNQSAFLIPGDRIWSEFRAGGGTVGMLFVQQSLGEQADLLLSPAPIHKHGGGMIEDCYSTPPQLYRHLCNRIGGSFRLRHYWGPLASKRSTEWIAAAAATILRSPQYRSDLLFCYLPHLDYGLQRYGPDASDRVQRDAEELACHLRKLVDAGRDAGYTVLVWGDYAMAPARRTVFPNRSLLRAGLLDTRRVGQRTYLDLFRSRAFAMVDHQVAHVYLLDSTAAASVRDCLESTPGVEVLLDHAALPHSGSGEFIAVAEPDAWFAYPWWNSPRESPDFATHVDIHRKPGYDPCELFFGGFFPPSVSLDTRRIRGTHGRTELAPCFATDMELDTFPKDIVALGAGVRQWLARR